MIRVKIKNPTENSFGIFYVSSCRKGFSQMKEQTGIVYSQFLTSSELLNAPFIITGIK